MCADKISFLAGFSVTSYYVQKLACTHTDKGICKWKTYHVFTTEMQSKTFEWNKPLQADEV